MTRHRLTNQEWRDMVRHNTREKALALRNSAKCEKVDIRTGMMEYLNSEHLKHAESQAFQFLCDSLEKFLKDAAEWEKNREALRVAKENFDSYIDFKDSHDREASTQTF